MTWYHSFSQTEWFITGIFCLLYILYIARLIRVSRQLHQSAVKLAIKLVLRSVYFGLLLVALLGPAIGETLKEVEAKGKDIFICVDLSASMNATDIEPSRLQEVKARLKEIIMANAGDRIGLIIFSADAFPQSPLTYDQPALLQLVSILNTQLVPHTGTDFGPPLRMALEKFQKDKALDTSEKSKLILLISDGEDFGSKTDEVLDEIKEAGIRLFTLGVGTKRGSTIPLKRGIKRDRDGNEVVTSLISDDLKRIASKTGGRYFELSNSTHDTKRLIAAIDAIEGEVRDSRLVDVSANRYYYFLGLALALMALDALMGINLFRL